MRRLTHSDAQALRRKPGATVALFLTDRCPVGCGHCSVGSRPDSPTITDWPLFEEIVRGVAALPSLEAVAITGGEPFAERRGLAHAVERLHAAGKAVVLFTSGHWAHATVQPWITRLLRLASTVYLSTDSFHRAGLARPQAVSHAAQAIRDAGCHLVVQVLDEPAALDFANALGGEVNVIAPLAIGRGASVFARPQERVHFGRCDLLNSPTIRFDGAITACCNEAVIMGAGPAALRRTIRSREEVAPALAGLRADPVLSLMGRHGPMALESFVDGPARTICDLCWTGLDRAASDPRAYVAATLLAASTADSRLLAPPTATVAANSPPPMPARQAVVPAGHAATPTASPAAVPVAKPRGVPR